MSANQNPDMWRSQGGPANPPNAPKVNAPTTSGVPKMPGTKPSASAAKSGDDEGKDAPQSSPKIGNTDGESQGAIKGGSPAVPDSGAKPKIEESGAGDSAAKQVNRGKAPDLPASATTASNGIPKAGTDPAGKLSDKLSDSSTNYLNNKIDSIGSNKPDKLDDPNRDAPSTSLGRDAEMGKEAIKGAVGGAAKGAAKGAISGGLHGAAAGATKEGIVKAADRINKTSATQRADQNKGPSNAGSLLDKASSSSSLDKSRSDMSARFGGGSAAAGATGGMKPAGTDLTPEEMASVAKAATTATTTITARTVQAASLAIIIVIGLCLAMITTVTSSIAPVAAATAAYQAKSVSCEAPKSGGTASPGNKGSESGLKPAGIKTMRYVNAQWGGKIGDIGTLRNDQDHATGNALDVMIPAYKSAEGNALGAEIANELQKNADKLGIKYLIWDSKFWNNPGGVSWTYAGTGKTYGPMEWAPYITNASSSDDTQMHRDHVHVSVKDQPGEPLEDAPSVSAASYVQSQLSPPTTDTLSFDRASFATLLPSENLGHQTDPGSIGLNTDEQVANARTIIGMSKTIGFGKEGALVGVTVALVESTLKNVNHGDAAGPDSTGLFQQRDHWGAREDRMNPAYAAQAFFLGVGNVPGLDAQPGWETMPVHQAAQAVQRSAYSDGSNYLTMIPLATRVVDALYDSSPNVPAVVAGSLNPPTRAANNDSSNNCGSGGVTDPGSVAAGDTYPARNESYCRSEACYEVQKNDSVAGGWRGECVDWADWKMVERAGVYGTHKVTKLGNGGDMADSAIVRNNFKIDMNPVAGDTVVFKMGRGGANSSAGHVATVQKVNGDGTIVIEEYNFGGDTPATGGGRYNIRTIQANEASNYIHFWDPAKSDEENKAKLISVGILVPAKGTWPRQKA